MARLLLLRHAKSSWGDAGLPDIDRPLSARGRRAAALMATAMSELGYLPDRVLCSAARRTRETLAALIPYLAGDTRTLITGELYEPPTGDYRAAIAAHGDGADILLLIGHNPAIQATALLLAGSGEPGLPERIAGKFPTGALAIIDFAAAGWTGLTPHGGRIAGFLTPRSLDPDDAGPED